VAQGADPVMKRLASLAWAAVVLCSGPEARGQIKISQVWGGGGDGAYFDADFVELHNPTSSAVSLAGWSVQYVPAIGAGTWEVTQLGGSIPAGGYFLISEAAAPAFAPALPSADVYGSINLSPSGGKVALCSTATPLVGFNFAPGVLVDLVGYGTGADLREPIVGGTIANNAPLVSGAAAEFRRGGGATDTDDNAADFRVGFPSPRTSGTPPNGGVTAIGFASPHILKAGNAVRIVVTPRLCATEGSVPPTTAVAADLTGIGGAAAAPLFDDGTNGDEVAADGMYSRLVVVPPGTLAGTKTIPLVLSAGPASGGGFVSVLVTTPLAPDNDNCATATYVPGPYNPPAVVAGSFADASPEYNGFALVPGIGGNTGTTPRRGLWYRVTGTGTTMTATTCPGTFNTVILVTCGTCDGLTPVVANDTASPTCPGAPMAASATWCSWVGADYFVWVGPSAVGPQTAAYALTISDDGVPCPYPITCVSCQPPPTAGAIVEEERGFGVGIDDGCDSTPQGFVDLALVQGVALTVVGTARGYAGLRDVDWYRFFVPADGTVTAALTAQFPAHLSLLTLASGGACSPIQSAAAFISACSGGALVSPVTAGSWYAFRLLHAPVPASFGGVAPGGTSYHYSLVVTLCATGACPSCQTMAANYIVAPGCAPVSGIIPGLLLSAPAFCTSVTAYVFNAPPGAPGYFVVGSPASIPIPGCTVCVDFIAPPLLLPFTADSLGTWSISAYVPDIPALQGVAFRALAGFITPSEFLLTHCRHLVFDY
jgi:Lamin Tail Domain